jgi:hypothetical protein
LSKDVTYLKYENQSPQGWAAFHERIPENARGAQDIYKHISFIFSFFRPEIVHTLWSETISIVKTFKENLSKEHFHTLPNVISELAKQLFKFYIEDN